MGKLGGRGDISEVGIKGSISRSIKSNNIFTLIARGGETFLGRHGRLLKASKVFFIVVQALIEDGSSQILQKYFSSRYFLWIFNGGIKLSTSMDITGEEFEAPMAVLRHLFCILSSFLRLLNEDDP